MASSIGRTSRLSVSNVLSVFRYSARSSLEDSMVASPLCELRGLQSSQAELRTYLNALWGNGAIDSHSSQFIAPQDIPRSGKNTHEPTVVRGCYPPGHCRARNIPPRRTGTVGNPATSQLLTRHGEKLVQLFNAPIAHAFVLPVWHVVQGLGMPDCSVSTGETNRNVCAATKLSLMVCSI